MTLSVDEKWALMFPLSAAAKTQAPTQQEELRALGFTDDDIADFEAAEETDALYVTMGQSVDPPEVGSIQWRVAQRRKSRG